MMTTAPLPASAATTNSCSACAPLGACVAFKGIAGAMPLLHGSQGCSTYIRRFLIGHFREPVDMASSSFSEETTIFGGAENLRAAIINLVEQYHPALIGIATTCLAETIGENMTLHIKSMEAVSDLLPPIVCVTTPSYRGNHIDGFRKTVSALIDRFARKTQPHRGITVFPGMLSPADLRHIHRLCADFDLPCTLVPDYSQTLDDGTWDRYTPIPEGGTTVDELTATGSCRASIEMGVTAVAGRSAGLLLEKKCRVPSRRIGLPIGIEANDRLFDILAELSGRPVPREHADARRRLVDAYVDGHKFLAGKRVAVYGDEDMAAALVQFAAEIGMHVAVVMNDAPAKALEKSSAPMLLEKEPIVLDDADFNDFEQVVAAAGPDLLIGNGRGYYLARKCNIPLVRVGFPIHDRIGAQRLLHVGYEGTLRLFDQIVNTIIEHDQAESDIGYTAW